MLRQSNREVRESHQSLKEDINERLKSINTSKYNSSNLSLTLPSTSSKNRQQSPSPTDLTHRQSQGIAPLPGNISDKTFTNISSEKQVKNVNTGNISPIGITSSSSNKNRTIDQSVRRHSSSLPTLSISSPTSTTTPRTTLIARQTQYGKGIATLSPTTNITSQPSPVGTTKPPLSTSPSGTYNSSMVPNITRIKRAASEDVINTNIDSPIYSQINVAQHIAKNISKPIPKEVARKISDSEPSPISGHYMNFTSKIQMNPKTKEISKKIADENSDSDSPTNIPDGKYMNFNANRSISNPRIGKDKKSKDASDDVSSNTISEEKVIVPPGVKSVRFSPSLISGATPSPCDISGRVSPISILDQTSPNSTTIHYFPKALKSCLKRSNNSKSSTIESPPIRPSFTEQIKIISDRVVDITNSLTQSYQLNKHPNPDSNNVLLSLPIRSFTIGNISCKSPSNVRFYSTYFEYTFNHPYEPTEVYLTMYYKDFISITLHQISENGVAMSSQLPGYAKFSFRLPKKLVCFIHDFDPVNPLHVISMDIYSSIAISSFKDRILPLIKSKRSPTNFLMTK